nr:class B sortase [bacterium]
MLFRHFLTPYYAPDTPASSSPEGPSNPADPGQAEGMQAGQTQPGAADDATPEGVAAPRESVPGSLDDGPADIKKQASAGKNKRLRSWIYTALLAFFVFVFTYSATSLVKDWIPRWQARRYYAGVVDGLKPARPSPTPTPDPGPKATPNPSQTPAPTPTPTHGLLKDLQAINPDCVAWLEVPGTKVNYPVMQGQDNDYYLTHTLDKSWNAAGSIFMDYRNNRFFLDNNTVIYGHRRRDSQMFYDLQKLRDQAYLDQYHTIELTLDDRFIQAEIFAVCVVPATMDYRQPNYATQESFDGLLSRIRQHKVAGRDIQPVFGQRIITLSTCVYDFKDARLVIFCLLGDDALDQPWQAP